MGCCSSTKPTSQITENGSFTSTEVHAPLLKRIPREKYPSLAWAEKEELGCNLQTPPLLNNNQLIFLSTHNNNTTYSIYDILTSQFTIKRKAIECEDTFDILNTVYTLKPDAEHSIIYFIENNKDIKYLDLNQNVVQSLNKSITTTQHNMAQIVYNKGNIFIIGAEEKSAADESEEYVVIPYSSAPARYSKPLIVNSAAASRVINIERDGTNTIFLMGGKQDTIMNYPDDNIWCVELLDAKGEHQWLNRPFFTDQPRHSFGIINYKNEYLIGFGGTELKDATMSTLPYIWFSPLEAMPQHNCWYEIQVKLPKAGEFHAICTDAYDILHLFGYDGTHYEVKMEDIVSRIKSGDFWKKRIWTEAAKTVLPTRARSVEEMSPRKGSVEILLERLGSEYEAYWEAFDDKDYTTKDTVIQDPRRCLAEIVPNEAHRNRIIEQLQARNDN